MLKMLEVPVSLISQSLPRTTLPDAGARSGKSAVTSARRAALFRESPWEICQRVALGTVWSLMPKRAGLLVPLTRLWLADRFHPQPGLPDPETLDEACEFAGMVHDLEPATLGAAYARGLFPKGHFGPLKWMSPASRSVLFFDEYHMPKRLRRLMRQGKYTVSFDRDFEGVIKACAGKREGRWHVTWITPRIMRAYAELYDAGAVHSFEVWNEAGALVGGGYGVASGGVFFTESQFSNEPNTSKLGFAVLNWHLARWGFSLNDGKRPTPTILDMGFRSIPRAEFTRRLAVAAGNAGKPGRWEVEAGPEIVAKGQPDTNKAPAAAASADA
jgi:leucyl/phenylalanyl-tRNA--protein transferase